MDEYGIFRAGSNQMRAADGKQRIYLEWPNLFVVTHFTPEAVQRKELKKLTRLGVLTKKTNCTATKDVPKIQYDILVCHTVYKNNVYLEVQKIIVVLPG